MMLKKSILRVLGATVLPLLFVGMAAAEAPTFSGFVDFGYNYNFNGMRTNTLRGFDATANSLTLQAAKLAASGKTGEVSYQIDLLMGSDASLTKSAGWNTGVGGNQVDLEQAFVSVPCPLTHGTVTFGKFVTPFGAEVIEAKDNFNTSRGLLFNYAIPFTHTGIKYSKSFGESLSLTGGLVNGWDNMTDNNKGKTFIAQAGYTPNKLWSALIGGAYGPEQASQVSTTANSVDTNGDGVNDAFPVTTVGPSTEKNSRSLVDAIFKIVPSDKLTFVANYDWGVEEGIAPTGTDSTQNWSGIGLHAKYMLNDTWAVAGRYENLGDEGSRTGARQSLNSITATLEHVMNGVISRLEFRNDSSNKKPFVDDKGVADDTQNTVSYQVIFPF